MKQNLPRLVVIFVLIAIISACNPPLPTSDEIGTLVGIESNTFTFPEKGEVYDPQYGGEKIQLDPNCDDKNETSQIIVAIANGQLRSFTSSTAGENTGGIQYCWSVKGNVDSAKINKMVQWLERNAKVNNPDLNIVGPIK